jgi:hypothetical protein
MYTYNNYIQYEIAFTGPPANDNTDWTADLWLAARMLFECRRRYLREDPSLLDPKGRSYRAILLSKNLELIRYCWDRIAGRSDPGP